MTSTRIECECGYRINVGPKVQLSTSCPRCSKGISIDTTSGVTARLSSWNFYGNRASDHWTALHQYPIDNQASWSPSLAYEWYKLWQKAVPQSTCDCSVSWSQLVGSYPPPFANPNAFFEWSVERHNDVNRALGKPVMAIVDARLRYRFPSNRGLVQHLISWDEFTRDTLLLAQQIVDRFPDVSGIAGCPRSGMRAAADLALRLDVPLYEASAAGGLRRCSGGSRIYKSEVHGIRRHSQEGPVVVVEDSTCSGTSIKELKQHRELSDLPVFAVYAGERGRSLVDGFAVNIDLPHWFEWNFFHNGQTLALHNVGIDWDGVLNADCLPQDDDDGVRYRNWMVSVKPIRLPRAYQIPYIITARREAFRAESEAWLRRYRINYGRLIMFPGSFEERTSTDIGAWKANMCAEQNVGLFVESSLIQAQRIGELLGRTVLCTEEIQTI